MEHHIELGVPSPSFELHFIIFHSLFHKMARKGQTTTPKRGKSKGTATAAAKTNKKCEQWNEFDEAKLLKLFETQAVDLGNISCAAIHEVIDKYFPDRPYTSFAPLYKRKLRAFNIDEAKKGARRGKFSSLLK